MEYLLNEEQKQLMKQIHEINEKKLEEAKTEKYNVEDWVKKNKLHQQEQKGTEQEILLVKYKENFLQKLK